MIGLLQKAERRRRRLRWLVRYWVLDKHRERLRGFAFAAAVVAALVMVGLLAVEVARPPEDPQVVRGFANIFIQVAILIISSLLSYALAPKPEEPKPQDAKAPVVEDGKSIIEIFGTEWIDDPIVLGWKAMGTTKIKAESGKK